MRERIIRWLAILAAMLLPTTAFAHEETPHDYHQLWRTWAFEPGIVIPIALTAWLYAQGLWRMWRGGRVARGVRAWQVACFAVGWLALVIALISPLHPWGRALFSAHMAQHELLMLVAAPLMVLGHPLAVFLKALPTNVARQLAQAGNSSWWQQIWRTVTNPLFAWLIHAIVLWAWHARSLMNATIENEWIHALQHLSFFLSALLFWWAVIYGRQRSLGYGMAVLYMFTTALHSGALGVLLTFASALWYPAYANTTQSWGLSPLEDQQLGGLIMWIPAGIVYIVAGLALMAGWLRESDARGLRRQAALARGALIICLTSVLCGCERRVQESARADTGGDVQRGRAKIAFFGCASCHTIPGVDGADAMIGPSLEHIASRTYLGGVVINTPQNMIEWVQHPRDIDAKSSMPNLHLEESDARDIACYLYTLR